MLKLGSRGAQVGRWQAFLIGLGYDVGRSGADGDFGALTESATKAFEEDHQITVNGVVDDETLQVAVPLGFGPFGVSSLPDLPSFGIVPSNKMNERFGELRVSDVRDGWMVGPGVDAFVARNIAWFELPFWVEGMPKNRKVQFHKDYGQKLVEFFEDIEAAGLKRLVLSYAGTLAMRLRRLGTAASMHAYGAAIDLNAPQNGLGRTPAAPGELGCVYELVPLAHQHGFYWGGHFRNPDGMHFEVGDT